MKDVYSEIADRIIAQLETGVIPWRKPWSGRPDGAISHATGRPYSLINQMILDRPGEYLTFNQVKSEGGKVKKGAKARFVVFWKVYQKQQKNDDGTPATNDAGEAVYINLPILRYFQVFHIDDTEGIAPKWDRNDAAGADPNAAAETVLQDYVRRENIQFADLANGKYMIKAMYAPMYPESRLEEIKEKLDLCAGSDLTASFQIRKTDGKSVIYTAVPTFTPELFAERVELSAMTPEQFAAAHAA